MASRYESLDHIKREFGLTSDAPDDLRKELRLAQKPLHPDLQSPTGVFASQEDRQKFEHIEQAIEFIDDHIERTRRGALVPVDTITDIVRVVRDLTTSRATTDSEQRLAAQTSRAVAEFRYQHRLPKITASTVTVVMTALWLFPSTIKDHPVLARFFDVSSNLFSMVWFECLLITGMLWLWLTILEGRHGRFVSTLKVESVQNQLFKAFLRSRREESLAASEADPELRKFTKDDFVHFLQEPRRVFMERTVPTVLHRLGGARRIDLELAHAIADAVVTRAEAKGVIAKDSKAGLTDVFTIVGEV